MELTVAALFGGTTSGIALNDIDFAQRRVFLLAIGQLTWQAHAIQNTFAACHFTGLACGFACTRSIHNFSANGLGVVRTLLQIVGQGFCDYVFNGCTNFARYQLIFGLAAELGLWHFDRQDTAKSFAHVIACYFYFGFFGEFVFFYVFVDDARHRCTQAR